ncbi:Zn-dependent protease [Kineococcus xinjiangensis]|uniref:Zinc metalloprotease n=1 Tax=Kineococcus xinjiangensis TaxID=512762 RepID=A0A2S6IKD5_9ACTN|nr:M50 family metallopeptidase [Kineococcus xinjiangensis]PPK94669.1 Zn-dependent protease [Kineococcus xinjiangensis]
MPSPSSAPAAAGAPEERTRRAGLLLGRPFGVPLMLSTSWLLFAAVITAVFGPRLSERIPGAGAYGVAFGYAVLLLLSVLAHEAAHAATARAVGMRVTGITLDVWGGHTTFADEAPSPGRSFLVAVTGPLANGLVALAAWGVLLAAELPPIAGLLVQALLVSNVLVAVFNLLPGLPLDGGHLLEALVWRLSGERTTGTAAAGWGGRVVAVLVLVAALGWPLLSGAEPSLLAVVWAALVSALLWQGAGQALRHARVRRRLPTLTAGALQRPAIAVPAGATVADVVARARARVDAGVDGQRLEVVLVTDDGVPVAVVDTAALQRVPEARRGGLTAGATARALGPRPVLRADLAGMALLDAVTHHGLGEHVVVDAGGTVVGLLRGGDVVRAVTGR